MKAKAAKPVKLKKSKEPVETKPPVDWPLLHAKNDAIMQLHLSSMKDGPSKTKIRAEIVEAASLKIVAAICKKLPPPPKPKPVAIPEKQPTVAKERVA